MWDLFFPRKKSEIWMCEVGEGEGGVKISASVVLSIF